jgi:hypothetical protein
VFVLSKCYIFITKTEWNKSESLEFVLVKFDVGTSCNAAGIKTAEAHLRIILSVATIIRCFVSALCTCPSSINCTFYIPPEMKVKRC